jgi:hypothetical protein
LQRQLPGKQTQALGFGFEGFMQTLVAKLREGFAFGLGEQRVEVVEFVRSSGRSSRNLFSACSCCCSDAAMVTP